MVRKVEMQSIGTPAVLKIVETDVGSPGAGQVRLVQDAIGINYVDVMVRTGLFPMRLPATLEFEAAAGGPSCPDRLMGSPMPVTDGTCDYTST
ncbi:hypothetical protein OSJ77_03545 [Phyllobacterium sp. 0TCS1.6C]|uniref:hypothetical protein n=1 Tax=unclassified Phyllobacterium TaxID=2638441 RepID=UPI0022651EE1|nr:MULTISPECIES: hypothetical protein [unclassified Phyllobacterium]MCX8279248.1 hypothetical protein [Phyllobacterium sp. 0TCS1.6C]MCX8294032.1 hypothetical protein [Phyllobacterium sp. 0TCS1.6A]